MNRHRIALGLVPGLLVAGLATATLLTSPAVALGPEQQPGAKIRIDPKALPAPYAPPSKSNPSRTVPKPADAKPTVPAGFAVNVFADKLGHARNAVIAPNGDVFLAQSSDNQVSVLQDDGSGKAKSVAVFADGFRYPYGIAFTKDAVLVGDLEGVWRIPYTPGDVKARAKQERITPAGAFGEPVGHTTRNVVVSPDGTKIYVAIGSRGNIGEEPEPRATIQEFAIDGSRRRTFGSGLRNAVGTAFAPGTNDLYTVVNERDTVGDELVPDYLTKVVDGGFYGWPYSYIGSNPEQKLEGKRPDLVKKAIVPDTLFRSHSAPVGLAFATGTSFPKDYQGGAWVALHGSWNATPPRGYHVVYVPFTNGKAADHYIVFASGFWAQNEDRAEVWGRPSGVAVMKDGALLIADEVSQTLWRVSYTGK